MNSELIIAIMGIAVIAIDWVVRLILAPTRRDRFVESLLDSVERNV